MNYWKPFLFSDKIVEAAAKLKFENELVEKILDKKIKKGDYVKIVKLANKYKLSFIPILGHTDVPRLKIKMKTEGGSYEI